MLNFDIRELIYNNLKDNDDKVDDDKDTLFINDKYGKSMNNFLKKVYYNEEDSYLSLNSLKKDITIDNITFKNKKLCVDIDATKKKIIKEYIDEYKKIINDKVNIDYKSLLFNNELKTNRLEVIKKYTDEKLLDDITTHLTHNYKQYVDELLETRKWCNKCKKPRQSDCYLDENWIINGKKCCEVCVKETRINSKAIYHFKDELINYNNFVYTSKSLYVENYDLDNLFKSNTTSTLLFLDEKEKIISVIHNHNINLMLNNSKKYSKKVLLDEMSKYHKYFKMIIPSYDDDYIVDF